MSASEYIKTVEWALVPVSGGGVYCEACGGFESHRDDRYGAEGRIMSCPIPAQGYRILKDEHWYERRWCKPCREGRVTTGPRRRCGLTLSPQGYEEGYIDCCNRHRGHDDGIHEPREGEL